MSDSNPPPVIALPPPPASLLTGAALFLDWALSRDGIMKVLAEELGRGVPRTGYKDIFPELNAEQYLVVEPT